MRRMALGLLALVVCGMMVGPAGMMVESGKPAPPPPPPEKWGTLGLHIANDQLVIVDNLGTGQPPYGYIRLYNWNAVTHKYEHVWTANGIGGCLIGDIYNDGNKELAGFNTVKTTTGSGKQQITTTTVYFNIWKNGDSSNSSSYSQILNGVISVPRRLGLGDVDHDGIKELISYNGSIAIWDFTKDSSPTNPTSIIYDNNRDIGQGGLEIGDSDNDGYPEMLVGEASDGRAAMVDFVNAINGVPQYKIVAHIGCRGVDDATVADLNKDGDNEIFMSGAMNGRVIIWKYCKDNDTYYEIWNVTYDSTVIKGFNYLQSNSAVDLDGDGYLEIVGGHDYNGYGTGQQYNWFFKIHMWKYDPKATTWKEYCNIITDYVGGEDTMCSGYPGGVNTNGIAVYDGTVLAYGADSTGTPILNSIQHISPLNLCMALDMG